MQPEAPDLIIVPHTGDYIPNENLSVTDQQAVKQSWLKWGIDPAPPPGGKQWAVAVAHWDGHGMTIRRAIKIPNYR